MKEKLKCILLVDDDEATNYIHTMILQEADCAETIKAVQSGYEAIEYLVEKVNGKYPQPDVIFLDVNMPGMNGWEFLEEYEKLPEEKKGNMVIVMLTTSLNPLDSDRASDIDVINGFKNKPLTIEMVNDLIEKNFPHLS